MAGIITGKVTVASAGTAVRFTTATTPIRSITVYAAGGNTGDVYVGASNVDNTDTPTAKATNFSITFRTHPEESPGDLMDFWVDAANTNDFITFRAVTL